MDKYKKLVKRCDYLEINVNDHKDESQTVEEYFKEYYFDDDIKERIGVDIYDLMIKKDTIVSVTAYIEDVLDYRIYHYDIDKAVDTIIDCWNGW